MVVPEPLYATSNIYANCRVTNVISPVPTPKYEKRKEVIVSATLSITNFMLASRAYMANKPTTHIFQRTISYSG